MKKQVIVPMLLVLCINVSTMDNKKFFDQEKLKNEDIMHDPGLVTYQQVFLEDVDQKTKDNFDTLKQEMLVDSDFNASVLNLLFNTCLNLNPLLNANAQTLFNNQTLILFHSVDTINVLHNYANESLDKSFIQNLKNTLESVLEKVCGDGDEDETSFIQIVKFVQLILNGGQSLNDEQRAYLQQEEQKIKQNKILVDAIKGCNTIALNKDVETASKAIVDYLKQLTHTK